MRRTANAAELQDMTQRLAAAGSNIDSLRALRTDVWKRAQPIDYPQTHPTQVDSFNKARLDSIWDKVLRPIHHRLAHAYLSEGRPTEALREVLAGTPVADSVLRFTPAYALTVCGAQELECREVMAQLDKAYPGFCLEGAGRSCGWRGVELAFGERRAVGQVFDVMVTDASRTPNGWLLTSYRSDPSTQTDCVGRFETDRIKEVRETTVFIERTTWCKQILSRFSAGRRVQYRVAQSDLSIKAGSMIRIYTSLSDMQTSTGSTIGTLFPSAHVIAVHDPRAGTMFVSNEEIESKWAIRMHLMSAPEN